MTTYFKKLATITFFSSYASFAFAPNNGFIAIGKKPPYQAFSNLIYALGMVETGIDTLAYNPVEEAVGFLQIRPIRLLDYNRRTGSNYTSRDAYSYKISEKIFLYYASKIGPYNYELIARNWNGSGRKTFIYWDQVKKYL